MKCDILYRLCVFQILYSCEPREKVVMVVMLAALSIKPMVCVL